MNGSTSKSTHFFTKPMAIWVAGLVLGGGFNTRALAEPARRFEQEQVHMGTLFRVVLYTETDATANQALARGFARIAELDQALSDYKDDSELNRLCRAPAGQPMPIGDDLFRVLDRSQYFARRSDGAFDATIGPLVRQWRRARRQKQLPTAAQLAQARRLVGFEKLALDADRQTATLALPMMQLDLGGIAKGDACDQALAAIREAAGPVALVDGGGGVSVGDPPPGRSHWTVAIHGATDANGQPLRLPLVRQSVATSGDAEQFVDLGGVRYSHIVDPRTGLGLTSRLQATVVCPRGIDADALATAVCVLGVTRGLALVDAQPDAAAFVLEPTPAGIVRHHSTRWARLVAEQERSINRHDADD